MGRLAVTDLEPGDPPSRRFAADWRRYAELPETELARLDVAALNLVCSLGLPGSEHIDVPACVQTLNGWAATVRRWTEAAYEQYFRPDPAQYQNSVAFFRAVVGQRPPEPLRGNVPTRQEGTRSGRPVWL